MDKAGNCLHRRDFVNIANPPGKAQPAALTLPLPRLPPPRGHREEGTVAGSGWGQWGQDGAGGAGMGISGNIAQPCPSPWPLGTATAPWGAAGCHPPWGR